MNDNKKKNKHTSYGNLLGSLSVASKTRSRKRQIRVNRNIIMFTKIPPAFEDLHTVPLVESSYGSMNL